MDAVKMQYVLTTELMQQKHYVAEKTFLHSSGNRVIVNYTSSARKAKRFASEGQAQDFSRTIINYCGYVYQAEPVAAPLVVVPKTSGS